MEFNEQPQPIPSLRPSIHDLVTADLVKRKCFYVASDMQCRKDLGLERYKSFLQANNGRDMGQDAYEEALDLSVYSRGCVEEGKQEWEEVYQSALELTIKISKLMLRQ